MAPNEDALQQAALEILIQHKRAEGDDAQPELTEIERLARTRSRARAVDEFRRRGRELRALGELARLARPEPSHLDSFVARDQREAFFRTVEKYLTRRDRQILRVMRDTDDHHEGASRVGMTPRAYTNAKTRVVRRVQIIVQRLELTL